VRRKRALDCGGIRVPAKNKEGFICLLNVSSYINSMDRNFYIDFEAEGQK
jgi:hypothetical protein